ncbi:putative ABC transport system permease protein [Limimonas halophila]|uniref:Putative ABC transport system permease protein n=1 Tax=Limimonas halophila TaxID=1082479 RepID=A0A1G7RHN6_9PROT|nr:FtsX-like permease family protein [Limimonas halophila]SDG10288.1 putative ABC transport system permease protein [Limimonas halophila]
MTDTLRLALRLARRELRGGLRGFWIFLGCLLLGVAAIAGVGSLSQAMLTGIANDGRALLGGEVAIRTIHAPASETQRAWLDREAERLSQTAELRAMARAPGAGQQTLVELKAVDDAYPLFGAARTQPEQPLDAALAERDGAWGALVAPTLARRLELTPGDRLRIGDRAYRVRGELTREPDRAAQAFTLGPRVLVHRASLDGSGLVQEGSLVYHHYRLDLPAGTDPAAWRDKLAAQFPDAGWRVRGLDSAAPGLTRFVDRVTLFMTLVGLTALLVGGVGVANAVRAYLDGKRATIATFKCVGAPARLVFATYLAQVLALAGVGIALGLVLGGALPAIARPLLAGTLNFEIAGGIYPQPLAVAALFGVLTTLAFALWPLARAQGIPAAALFRDVVAERAARPPGWALAAIGAAGAALAGLAVWTADDRLFALGFVAGAAGALLAFRLAAAGVVALAKRVPRARRPGLRLAVANLHRPGAPTGSVVTSLGLGLTVLVAIALIDGNLTRQVTQQMPKDAPAYYFIDIQPDQLDPFKATARGVEGVREVQAVPMLRGRIVKVNGTRVPELTIPEDVQWMFDGDRGVTWAREVPSNSRVVRGQWWDRDHSGRQLVSIDAELGRAMQLAPGDTLTINLLGRNVEAEIANWREIDWEGLGINFVMVFSPGVVSQAPQSYLATAKAPPQQEAALESAVAEGFPNVSAIRTREVLNRVSELLGKVALAVRATASITLLAGTLVLAGAVAAGHRRRIYDAVVLKVLGATRRNVTVAFLLEYGLLGLVTAAIASVIGSVAAWVVMTRVMDGDFVMMPGVVAATAVAATAVTLVVGYAGTDRALRQKAAPLLRNE